ncbi:hypothetical protein ACHAWF_003969 [Thalassiosira exigua]
MYSRGGATAAGFAGDGRSLFAEEEGNDDGNDDGIGNGNGNCRDNDEDDWEVTEALFTQHACGLSQAVGSEDTDGDDDDDDDDADVDALGPENLTKQQLAQPQRLARVSSASEDATDHYNFSQDDLDLDDDLSNIDLDAIVHTHSLRKDPGAAPADNPAGMLAGRNLNEEWRKEAKTPAASAKRPSSLLDAVKQGACGGRKRRKSNGATPAAQANTLRSMWQSKPLTGSNSQLKRIAPGTVKKELDGSVYIEGRLGRDSKLLKVGEIWESSERELKTHGFAFTIEDMHCEGGVWKAKYSAAWIKLERTFISGAHASVIKKHTGSEWALVKRHPALPKDGKVILSKLCNRLTKGLPNEKTSLCYEMADVFTHSYYYGLGKCKWTPPAQPSPSFTAMDAFAGAGGMSCGLKAEGINVKYKIEWNGAACKTLRLNFPDSDIIRDDIADHVNFAKFCKDNKVENVHPRDTELLYTHGSPPCQGVSLVNTSGGANDAQNNKCTLIFLELVQFYQPKFASMENVVGIKTKGLDMLMQVEAGLLASDYQVQLCKVLASDYGDPQDRPRVILLVSKRGWRLPSIPEATHGGDRLRIRTARDALGDLELIEPTETGYAQLPDGTEILDHYKEGTEFSTKHDNNYRLDANRPANTIRKGNPIKHYKLNRYITARERARLQSFPDGFRFYGTPSEIRDQIGNAVPVELARAIGRSILKSYRHGRHDKP